MKNGDVPHSAMRDRILARASCQWFRTSLAALSGLGLLLAPTAGAEHQVLRGHVPPGLARVQPLGRLEPLRRLNLAVGLPLRNRQALTHLLQAICDPASPRFRQYLTPEQFTSNFGPTEQDYEAVAAFLGAHGLTVTTRHPNRLLLSVSGTVADIEQAFHLNLNLYPHPDEARTCYAPDTEPVLDLAAPVLHISGLDNYRLPRPALVAPVDRPPGPTPHLGAGPNGAYMGNDFRAAYVPGVSLDGAGQAVGLLEFDGFYANDITAYETKAALPTVPLQTVLLDSFDGAPGKANNEVALDIEMAISMAPGLSKVIVYEAGPQGNGDDVLNRMATDNSAKQLSSSWRRGEQFIDAIPMRFRRAMLDKHITRLVKSDNGGPTFEQIHNPGEVIKLAARGGAFDLGREFGVPAERIRGARPRHQPGHRGRHRCVVRCGHPPDDALQEHQQGHPTARAVGVARRPARQHRRDLRLRLSRLRLLCGLHGRLLCRSRPPRPTGPAGGPEGTPRRTTP